MKKKNTKSKSPRYWYDPEKKIARDRAIKRTLQEFYPDGLPGDYVTLCGPCFDEDTGRIAWGSELHYICTREKLVAPERFVGVDANPDVIILNYRCQLPARWINDELGDAIVSNKLSPSFINCDLMTTPIRACSYVASLMLKLSYLSQVVMPVNMILRHRCFDFKRDDAIQAVLEQPDFRRSGWNFCGSNTPYRSDGKGAATMVTIFFEKGFDGLKTMI